jgi:hypothetical protein
VLNTVDTARHRDDGLLTRAVLGRAGWPQPLLLAAGAAIVVLALVVAMLTDRLGGGDARVAVVVAALVGLVAGTAARRSHGGPLDWLAPAGLRAVEYLLVVAAGLAGRVPPAVVFLLLFALALRHYDLTARMEKGAPAAGGAGPLLGWDGRIVLLAGATLAGHATLGIAVLAGIVVGGFLVGAINDWRSAAGAR